MMINLVGLNIVIILQLLDLQFVNSQFHMMCILFFLFFCSKAAEGNPIVVSSVFAHCSKETTSVRPDLPEVIITVDMVVLARRRAMRWQRGKVVEIVLKGKMLGGIHELGLKHVN